LFEAHLALPKPGPGTPPPEEFRMLSLIRPRVLIRAQNWRALALVVYGTLLIYGVCLIDLKGGPAQALQWFQGLGPLGHALFFCALALSIALILPTTPFEFSAGLFLPFPIAAFYCVLAEASGACLALLAARHLFPRHWRHRLLTHRRMHSLAHVLCHHGWRMVLLTRLMPLFPVKLTNYAYGFTPIRLSAFFLGSLIGIAPRVALYVYMGSLAGHAVGTGVAPFGSIAHWSLLLAGGTLALLCFVIIARMVRQALQFEHFGLEPTPCVSEQS
jgi:uncharacterized membrane protein YdjX (TVP38/TMEM64 family)